MFNGVQPFGVIGPFRERQLQDCFQYLVYPWFMALLFVVSGMSARYDAYRKTGYSKRFLETHRTEITLHKAVKAALDEADLKKTPQGQGVGRGIF